MLGLSLILIWVYLSFFSYPSTAWVNNGNVHVINWDSFSNSYVESVDEADGFGVVVLTDPNETTVNMLLADGSNVLVIGGEDGCRIEGSDRICGMEFSYSDADYKYPLFYLAGVPWMYWLNLAAPVFLVVGLVLLKDVFADRRFAVAVIFLFALFGARKYIIGMPMTLDIEFHLPKLVLASEGSFVSDLLAIGITTVHYYPPLFYWFWSLFVHFVGIVSTIKLIAFFTLFFSGLSAYVAIRGLTKTQHATTIALAYMLYPFLPFSSQKVHEYLGFPGDIERYVRENPLQMLPRQGQKLIKPSPLFTKLDEKLIEEETSRMGKAIDY